MGAQSEINLKIVNGKSGLAEVMVSKDKSVAILLHNGIRWHSLDIKTLKSFYEFYSSADMAYGDVLITGLGFGMMLRLLEKKDTVKSITVLELYQDVIDLFLSNNTISNKTKIICANASTYKDEKKYDCVLLDHYENQMWQWKVDDINTISKNIKHDVFWVWSLEGMFYETFMNSGIFPSTMSRQPHTSELAPNFEQQWPRFVEEFFPDQEFLKNISLQKIKKYVTMFYTEKNKFVE